MTAPVTTDALVDLIARLRATNPWKKTAIAEDLMREAADAIQQVAAERDEDRAELARLQAEGEDLRAALRFVKTWIDTDLPAGTSRAGTVHRVITKALDPTALARAATAREGQADE